MKNEMRKILSVASIFIVALCINACRNNEIEPEVDPNGGGIGTSDLVFSIGGISTDTKSGKAVRPVVSDLVPFDSEPGEEPLFLEESVISLDDIYNNSSVETKGIPTYTENFAGMYKNFGAKVFTPGTSLGSFTNGSTIMFLDSSSDSKPLKYKYAFTSGQWLGSYGDELMFFMSAPDMATTAPTTASPIAGVTSIDYGTTTASGKDGGVITINYTSPAAAADQTDILFTSKNLKREDYVKDNKTGNSVLMYHALAGVKFQCGNTVVDSNTGKPIKDSYVNVTKIELKGIANTGTCVITPTFDSEGYVCEGNSNNASQSPKQVAKSKVVSDWGTTPSGSATFTLSKETGLDVNNAEAGQFPSSFYGSSTNNLGDANFMDTAFANTFFLIPQTLGTNAELVVTYKMMMPNDKGEFVMTENKKSISLAGRKWYAGELYTYRITVKELGVHITDTMESENMNKKDIQITNTRNTNEYLRVAVIGNWFDNHEDKETTLEPGHVIVDKTWSDAVISFNTNDWTYVDGYYYYHYQLKGGATIPAARTLFSSYTYVTPGKAGAHLELTLAVQAVDASKISTIPWAGKGEFEQKIDDGTTVTAIQ